MNEYRLQHFTFQEASPVPLNTGDRIVAVLDHYTVPVSDRIDYRVLALVEHDTGRDGERDANEIDQLDQLVQTVREALANHHSYTAPRPSDGLMFHDDDACQVDDGIRALGILVSRLKEARSTEQGE